MEQVVSNKINYKNPFFLGKERRKGKEGKKEKKKERKKEDVFFLNKKRKAKWDGYTLSFFLSFFLSSN